MTNVHRSMQGKMIDMDKLMRQNELMPAIGNVRVNARGDELGPGGKIIRKREDVMQDYYKGNPNAKSESPQPVEQRAPVIARSTVDTTTPSRKRVNDEG